MFNYDNFIKLWPNKEWKVKQQKNPENKTRNTIASESKEFKKKKNKVAEV